MFESIFILPQLKTTSLFFWFQGCNYDSTGRARKSKWIVGHGAGQGIWTDRHSVCKEEVGITSAWGIWQTVFYFIAVFLETGLYNLLQNV